MKNPRKIWTWNLDWVLPFESNWSVINKFCALNCISPNDITHIFCNVSGFKQTPNSFNTFGKWNYNSDILLSTFEFRELVGDINFNTSNLSSIMPALWIKKLTPYNVLRFCPNCIKMGYHSIIYQLLFIDKCPIHQSKLRSECIKCKMTIEYDIKHNQSVSFGCNRCKTTFWTPFHLCCTSTKKPFHISESNQNELSNVWTSLQHFDFKNCISSNTSRQTTSVYYVNTDVTKMFAHLNDIIGLQSSHLIDFKLHADHCHSVITSFCATHLELNRKITGKVRPPQMSLKPIPNYEPLDIDRIFKSIQKQIFKKMMSNPTRKCYSKKCLVISEFISLNCPQVKGITNWLNFWTHCKGHKNRVVWELPVLNFSNEISIELTNWLVQRIFAFEVYWSFWHYYFVTITSPTNIHRPCDKFKIDYPFWLAKFVNGRIFFHSWPYRTLVNLRQEHEQISFLFGSKWRCGPMKRAGKLHF